MFLLIGSFLMAIGLLLVLHLLIFTKAHKIIDYIIVIIIGMALIISLSVHGVWLGMMIIIIGILWIKFFKKNKQNSE